MIGKPDGGERPIGLLTFFMRIYTRVRRCYTRDWTQKRAEHWDYAIKSSSSLRSALLQKLRVEVARHKKEEWALYLMGHDQVL